MVLLGAIDQGTSSSRFLVFDADSGQIVAFHQIEVRQRFPEPGWVEMDPLEIADSVDRCIENACGNLRVNGFSVADIAAVGIANQRETTVVWDRETGQPLYNAIVWLDTRTTQLADAYTNKTPNCNRDHFKSTTGLPIHPYFSALKLRWLLENVESVKRASDRGTLMFGTVDCWLIWHLCRVHATDVTNASRTMLFDLNQGQWSTNMCSFFAIPMEILPEIRSSSEIFGTICQGAPLPPSFSGSLRGIRIAGCLGDQQAALVGHSCLNRGDSKSTYGTGTFMLCNLGTKSTVSGNGLLTTVAFQFGQEAPLFYALEASGAIGGNAIRFLRDNLKLIQRTPDVEQLASSVSDSGGVVFVPCFTGLYSPYWDPSARATICGIDNNTTSAHIARAALEAIACQSADMLQAIQSDLTDMNIQELKIDGGLTANRLFDQLLADVIGMDVCCSQLSEISGWGAAVAAGIACGYLSLDNFSLRDQNNNSVIRYLPRSDDVERSRRMRRWKAAVRRARKWTDDCEEI